MNKSVRNTSLLSLLDEELKNYDKKKSFKDFIADLYYPKKETYIFFFSIFAIILILMYSGRILLLLGIEGIETFEFQYIFPDTNHYQNLIAVLAGIGSIIFGLILFIAESMRDPESSDKARVLLRESYLFPLVLLEVFSFIMLLWVEINFLGIILISTIGILSIRSLHKLIIVLLNNYTFSIKRTEMLRDRMNQSFKLAIKERIGKNILIVFLEKKSIKLQYSPFVIGEESRYHFIKSKEFGIVTDINLKIIDEISNIIEIEAKINGFSYTDKKYPDVETNKNTTVKESQSKKLIPNNQRYLQKSYHDAVNETNRNLLYFDEKLVKNQQVLDLINIKTQKAFSISKEDTFSDEVRFELSNIKDQFISAIQSKRIGAVEELSKLYISLAEGFIKQISLYGDNYSYESAIQERRSTFYGWEQIRWLSTDLRILINKAIESQDIEIIRKAAYIPIAISRRAIQNRDHYFFQEFIWFPELLFRGALTLNNESVKQYLIDRSWRYLKEISDFYVEANIMKESLQKDELESLKNFGIHFYQIFQNLLKTAYDAKDINSFKKFQKACLSLFSNFKPSRKARNSEMMFSELSNPNLTLEQKEVLNNKLRECRIIENIENEISTKRYQMLFGLSSWILSEYKFNKDDNLLKQFYLSGESIFPSDIVHFTEIFLATHNFDVEDHWGWSSWELTEEGVFQNIQILNKLELFFAIKSLTILENISEDDSLVIEIPYNRDLVSLADGVRDLKNIINNIKENPQDWEFILSISAIEKTDLLISLIAKAKEKQIAEDKRIKRERDISLKKINEFQKKFIEAYYDNASFRNLFDFYDLSEITIEELVEYDEERFGINSVDDKASFFDDWHVHFSGWGENYGSSFARGEDLAILEKIIENSIEIYDIDSTLEKLENIENLVILAPKNVFWKNYRDSQNFLPEWQLSDHLHTLQDFGGIYKYNNKEIPVFYTHFGNIYNEIFIVNIKSFGKIVQFTPIANENERSLLNDIFFISVRAFSQNETLLKEFLGNPPDWLEKYGNEEDKINHLKELVLVNIYVRYIYEISESYNVYRMKLSA